MNLLDFYFEFNQLMKNHLKLVQKFMQPTICPEGDRCGFSIVLSNADLVYETEPG
jgi:hypothetical protein